MKSKAPNQPDFGLQYDADGMILDPHPPLPFDPDAVSSMKRTEDMTVAETLDAIFGAGTTDQIFTSEEAAIARQPFNSDDVAAPVKIDAEAFRVLFPIGMATVHCRTSETYGLVETPLVVESSNETRIVFRRTEAGKKGSIRHVFNLEIEHDPIVYELISDGVRVRCGSDSWTYTLESR